MLQIVASLIDAARGFIYDRHMFIVQATGYSRAARYLIEVVMNSKFGQITWRHIKSMAHIQPLLE